jgi:RNA-directed DNA polymerase
LAKSLTTPLRIRRLQRKLYAKAKQEPACRFHQLYDKVYRGDILLHAYRLCRANQGAPGVDGESFADIEKWGRIEWLEGLQRELKARHFLRRRSKVIGQGFGRFNSRVILGELGVPRLSALAKSPA